MVKKIRPSYFWVELKPHFIIIELKNGKRLNLIILSTPFKLSVYPLGVARSPGLELLTYKKVTCFLRTGLNCLDNIFKDKTKEGHLLNKTLIKKTLQTVITFGQAIFDYNY
jgi:hypothetical protein